MAHVLVVEAPGAWLSRVILEQQVRQKGWRLALSPADADVLAVCGASGPALEGTVSNLWDLMPGPRARIHVSTADRDVVAEHLDRAEMALLDVQQQDDDSRSRPAAPELKQQDSGHGGMDHGGMDMAPGGIPLAQGGEDRDRLEMDVLHVVLGPVLPYWPAGLVVRCSLQGDVIVEAEVDRVDGRHERGHDPDLEANHEQAQHGVEPGVTAQPIDRLRSAAVRCDNVSKLLMLAGWDDAGAQALRLRDSLLCGDDGTGAARAVERLRGRVAGSFLLRWALRGLGPLDSAALERHGLPEHLRGDTRDRLLSMLDRASADLEASAGSAAEKPRRQPAVTLETVPCLVTGLDLATARLVVASLDLDPLQPMREDARA